MKEIRYAIQEEKGTLQTQFADIEKVNAIFMFVS
jgi:hypothetical protein